MKKRGIIALFLAGALTTSLPGMDVGAAWKSDANGRYFTQKASPGYAVGWKKIGKYHYYFNTDKYAAVGWKLIKNDWYYFNAKGRMLSGIWIDDSYLGADGKMVKNTVIDGILIDENGNRITDNPTESTTAGTTSSKALKNTWVLRDGNKYYYDYRGKLAAGFFTIKDATYYFDPDTGILQSGVVKVGKKYYYFDPDTGVQKTGYIVLKDGTGYYFSPKTKAAYKGWHKIGKKYYYFNSKGVLQRNKWISKKYYVDHLGRRCKGWLTLNNKTYYLNPKTGIRTKGLTRIGNDTYYFKTNGVMLQNQWKKNRFFQADGKMAVKTWVNNQYVNANGCITKTKSAGFFTEKKKTYYIRANLTMAKNCWELINNKWYFFKSNGVLLKNAWKDNYYVDADGVRVLDRFYTINKVTYLFLPDGTLAKGFADYKENRYYLDPVSGAMKTGFQLINGLNYYFDPSNGVMARNTVLTINDSVYSFDANGAATLDASGYAMGRSIAEYAQKFIGYPYSYGGATDLTKGVDCSGFVKLVFQHFGIKLPRTSQAQALGHNSKEPGGPFAQVKYVSEKELLPGDVIGYYYTAPTHVAIYIGNGKVVHASNSQPYPKGGIKISDYDLGNPKNITRIMRYW